GGDGINHGSPKNKAPSVLHAAVLGTQRGQQKMDKIPSRRPSSSSPPGASPSQLLDERNRVTADLDQLLESMKTKLETSEPSGASPMFGYREEINDTTGAASNNNASSPAPAAALHLPLPSSAMTENEVARVRVELGLGSWIPGSSILPKVNLTEAVLPALTPRSGAMVHALPHQAQQQVIHHNEQGDYILMDPRSCTTTPRMNSNSLLTSAAGSQQHTPTSTTAAALNMTVQKILLEKFAELDERLARSIADVGKQAVEKKAFLKGEHVRKKMQYLNELDRDLQRKFLELDDILAKRKVELEAEYAKRANDADFRYARNALEMSFAAVGNKYAKLTPPAGIQVVRTAPIGGGSTNNSMGLGGNGTGGGEVVASRSSAASRQYSYSQSSSNVFATPAPPAFYNRASSSRTPRGWSSLQPTAASFCSNTRSRTPSNAYSQVQPMCFFGDQDHAVNVKRSSSSAVGRSFFQSTKTPPITPINSVQGGTSSPKLGSFCRSESGNIGFIRGGTITPRNSSTASNFLKSGSSSRFLAPERTPRTPGLVSSSLSSTTPRRQTLGGIIGPRPPLGSSTSLQQSPFAQSRSSKNTRTTSASATFLLG
ncbi:unnamed protein product, partial [Amoebophrya sp. A25]